MLIRASIALSAVLLFCSISSRAQSGYSWIVYERDIHFDTDEVLLGYISDLAVGPDGQLIVLDVPGQVIHLFDRDGGWIKELDPAACHPGFEKRYNAVTAGTDRIFVAGEAFRIRHVHDGLIFESVQPEEDDPDMPNPHLRVYRWVGPDR